MLAIRPGPARKILCFDIENKPGTYGPGDYTHGKVTAIACQFVDETKIHSWCMERAKKGRMTDAAREFVALWGEAGAVMGHNIRRHDIRLLNGFLWTLDMPPLPDRRIIDTFRDAPRTAGLSKSLENLCARWGCPHHKVEMPEPVWEHAYDGVPTAVERMRVRVETDVRMNIWLFHELRKRGLLP